MIDRQGDSSRPSTGRFDESRGWLREAAGRLAGRCGFLLVVVIATACRPPTHGTVSGTVTIDGKPAASGSIAFIPADGISAPAGGEITAGRYSAVVSPGSARVEIRCPKVIGERKLYDTPDSPIKPVLAESLPARYNDESVLTVDVRLGANPHDFDLTTD